MSVHWDLNNLRLELNSLQKDQAFAIAREVFAEIFPPGAHDLSAMEQCSRFATSCGCVVENDHDVPEVIFKRP